MTPRLACGPPSPGLACEIARNAFSASALRPLRRYRLASSKARCVAGSTGSSGGGAAGRGAADVAAPDDDGVIAWRIALKGSETVPQPAVPVTSARTHSERASSADRIDDSFAHFALAVAHRAQLAQRVEAALDPLVVDAVAGAVGVELMQLGRLFLEREGLLLEQHVVLLELDLGELLRPLRCHQGLSEVAVDRGDAVGRGSRHVGHAIVGGDRVRLERLLHLLLLQLQLAGQRLDQLHL